MLGETCFISWIELSFSRMIQFTTNCNNGNFFPPLKCIILPFHAVLVITWNFFRNQSAAGNVIELTKKKKERKALPC